MFKADDISFFTTGMQIFKCRALHYYVWQRRIRTYPIHSHTLTYVRDTYSIRHASYRFKYAGICRCTFCYTQTPHFVWDMFNNYQRMRVNTIYATHALTTHMVYALYARHTLNTLRYSYVIRTLSTR